MRKQIDLTIIIVEYKSGAYLNNLLTGLPKRADWEVIVIDNNTENIGYGAGCNKGARSARGKHLLFLNPDVQIDEKNIERMLKYLHAHPEVGVVGPQFINADKQIEQSSTQFPTFGRALVALSFLNSVFPKNRISQHFWMTRWNRKTTEAVDVVSGAALMVRANEFRIVGEFDPAFFLYWEEFDLCKRMHDHMRSTVFLSTASAHHPRAVSMKQADLDTEEIFQQSRRRYFAKHLGFAKMALLEAWFLLTEQWRLCIILVTSLFMRLYALDHIRFIGDVGRDYLQALGMVRLEHFPLLGIPSSIPRFSQGPFNVWFDALSFAFGGASVFAPPMFAAVLTSMAVLLLYRLLEKPMGKQISFICALVLAISPAAIAQSRMPFYLFAEPFFLIVYLWRLMKIDSRSPRTVFWAVLSFWILFQWELATLPLIALLPLVMLRAKPSWPKTVLAVVAASTMGLLPQIIHDVANRCAQLCGLVAWSGYRVLAVSGFDGRHGYSAEKIGEVVRQFGVQLSHLISVHWIFALTMCVFLCFGVVRILRNKMQRSEKLFAFSLSGLLLITLGIFVHGSPSEAYFPPMLVFIPILLGYVLRSLPAIWKAGVSGVVISMVLVNAVVLTKQTFNTNSVLPQIEAAGWIVDTAQGAPVALESFDEPAGFASYLDGMRFLIVTRGGQIADDGLLYFVSFDDDVKFPLNVYSISAYPGLRVAQEGDR